MISSVLHYSFCVWIWYVQYRYKVLGHLLMRASMISSGEVGLSQWYCNTGQTRDKAGASSWTSSPVKNQFNIEEDTWSSCQILSWQEQILHFDLSQKAEKRCWVSAGNLTQSQNILFNNCLQHFCWMLWIIFHIQTQEMDWLMISLKKFGYILKCPWSHVSERLKQWYRCCHLHGHIDKTCHYLPT